MTLRIASTVGAVLAAASAILLAGPSIFPTGTTTYRPDRAWNGFSVLSPLGTPAVIVIDMNGKIVKQWEGYNNSAGGPARVFPGGVVVAAAGANPPRQESLELVQRDFNGNVLWRFDHNEQIAVPEGQTKETKTVWSARQHHDWQRQDFPAGYYSAGAAPGIEGGDTLLLTHTIRVQPKVAPGATLEDDRLIEISREGKVVWDWVASDHIDEFHFDTNARKVISSAFGVNATRGSFDWVHLNSATYVGPNHWYDEGDKRFAPNNVIVSSREASFGF